MASYSYLGFEPLEQPKWRDLHEFKDIIPSVSTMVSQIIQYRRTWKKIERMKRKNSKKYEDVQQEMYLEFLYQIQVGEDIGILNRKTFDEVIHDENNRMVPKHGLKRHYEEQKENGTKFKCRKSDSLGSLEDKIEKYTMSASQTSSNSSTSLSQRSNNLSNEDGYDSQSLPSSQDAHLLMINVLQNEQARTTETINLLRGYHHLKNELQKIPKDERSGYLGIIDVETCIKSCHEILMTDLLDKTRTPPGKFSTLPRSAEFEGKCFFYPSYYTEEIAYDAVQAIVDQYNRMIDEISTIEDDKEKLKNSFKCASVLLFSFLTLHPFSDGNGRLARLLCNHCLKTFCPFPTAIYNNFSPSKRSDYICALVNAREGLQLSSFQHQYSSDSVREALLILNQKPSELCSLIIESNWFTWRHFLRKVGVNVPFLDFERRV